MKAVFLAFFAACLCLTQALPHGRTDGSEGHHGHGHDDHRGHSHADHVHSHLNQDKQGHESHNHESHGHQPGHHHGGHESLHKRLMRECALCVRQCRSDTGGTFERCVAEDNVRCAAACYPEHRIGECLICIRQCATDLETSSDPAHQPHKITRGKRITYCVKNLLSPCHRPCHHFHGEDN